MSAQVASISLALIPARGGSRGLPGKNVRILGDKPLIAWTVAAALSSNEFQRVVVSTDNDEIAAAALAAGAEVPFRRPAHLATDTATTRDVVDHALQHCRGVDTFALLQPTSPFRGAQHIREAANIFATRSFPAVIAVTPAKPASWTFALSPDGLMLPTVSGKIASRRQDDRTLVQPNGSMYLMTREVFERSPSFIPSGAAAFPMDGLSSLDIDGPDDMRIAEALVMSGYPSETT